jgi:hypothetical protein
MGGVKVAYFKWNALDARCCTYRLGFFIVCVGLCIVDGGWRLFVGCWPSAVGAVEFGYLSYILYLLKKNMK